MKTHVIFCLAIISLAIKANAQTMNNAITKIQSYKAGGVPILIPCPNTDLVEVGSDNREGMNVFVPENNRLLCAFVLKEDLSLLFTDESKNIMSKYALVEVPRGGENMSCEQSDFKIVIDGIKESFNDALPSVMNESEDILNSRLKSLDIDNLNVKIGQPISLGCFFQKNDIYGLGMLMEVNMGGVDTKMGAAIILLRVKKRLLFVYLYAEYKNDETIKWLRTVGEKWSGEILKANT